MTNREIKEKLLPRVGKVSEVEDAANANAGDILPRVAGLLKGDFKVTDLAPRLKGLGVEDLSNLEDMEGELLG